MNSIRQLKRFAPAAGLAAALALPPLAPAPCSAQERQPERGTPELTVLSGESANLRVTIEDRPRAEAQTAGELRPEQISGARFDAELLAATWNKWAPAPDAVRETLPGVVPGYARQLARAEARPSASSAELAWQQEGRRTEMLPQALRRRVARALSDSGISREGRAEAWDGFSDSFTLAISLTPRPLTNEEIAELLVAARTLSDANAELTENAAAALALRFRNILADAGAPGLRADTAAVSLLALACAEPQPAAAAEVASEEAAAAESPE